MSADQLEAFLKEYRRRFALNGSFMTSFILVLADMVCLLLCFCFGFFVVNTYDRDIIDFKSFITYWPYIPFFILAFGLLHLYPGLSLAPAEELKRYTTASLMGHAVIILSLYIQRKQLDAYSVAFGLSWLGSVIGFPVARATARDMVKNAEWWGVPAIIFGAGTTGRMIADRMLNKPWMGYRPAAILDDDPELEGEYRGIPIIADCDLGPAVAARCRSATAVVAMPTVSRERLAAIVADDVRSFKHYILIPDFFGMTSGWMTVRDLDGVLGLYTAQRLLGAWSRGVKRFFDLFLSIVGGLIISPFMLLIGILVKIDSPGPMFYGHHRLGKDGVPFKAWKFRSMVTDGDEVLAKLLASDPAAKAEWEASYKLKNDPRVTRMGRFLRKTSLDELPQIWNVIRGEMSLVGPRPIIEDEIPKYGHHYKLFSSVKPGMAGLWQVSGRSDTNYEERVALDIYYIQSWSLWMDLYILFKLPHEIFAGDGAY